MCGWQEYSIAPAIFPYTVDSDGSFSAPSAAVIGLVSVLDSLLPLLMTLRWLW